MTLPKVFVTRQIPSSLDELHQIAAVEVWPERQPPPPEVLREKAAIAEGLLCLLTDPVNRALLEASPQLRVVSQMAVGYDNINVPAATERGIPVGHTPDVLTSATADFTWALLMAVARRIVEGDRLTRAGLWKTWEPDLLLGPDVGGATLGIVGFGRIGQAVAKRALGFEMRILYCGRQPVEIEVARSLQAEFVSFETLLQTSDFVSLHVPLTPETQHLMGDRAFSLMKPSAILINTARGSVVDQEALFRALSQRQIAAAAIDVTDPEPLPMDSPLLTLDNLIITPHLGSASQQTRAKMAQMAIANLIAGLKGDRLPHCVNPQVYSR